MLYYRYVDNLWGAWVMKCFQQPVLHPSLYLYHFVSTVIQSILLHNSQEAEASIQLANAVWVDGRLQPQDRRAADDSGISSINKQYLANFENKSIKWTIGLVVWFSLRVPKPTCERSRVRSTDSPQFFANFLYIIPWHECMECMLSV